MGLVSMCFHTETLSNISFVTPSPSNMNVPRSILKQHVYHQHDLVAWQLGKRMVNLQFCAAIMYLDRMSTNMLLLGMFSNNNMTHDAVVLVASSTADM